MKITCIVLSLSFAALTTSGQIERKPALIKTDSTQTTGNDRKVDKQSRKERFKELDLTREQKSKLKEIMQANKAAKEAVENNAQLSDTDKKKQINKLQNEQTQNIQSILTPQQI